MCAPMNPALVKSAKAGSKGRENVIAAKDVLKARAANILDASAMFHKYPADCELDVYLQRPTVYGRPGLLALDIGGR
jgi:hypothetical protein